MRSTILVIFSAIALAGLFIGYWTMQPTNPASTIVDAAPRKVGPAPKRNDPNEKNGIRSGEYAWLKETDSKGVVTSEFRGEQYHPRPNGTIDIVNPTAEFFQANHQRLELRGKTGNVVLKELPDPAKSAFGGPSAAPPAPPSRGRLDDVTVTLFDETPGKPRQAVLTMTTRNVVFDNETFRIFTQGYRDEQGRQIDNDQVPVIIRGEINMNGRGLKARWNDRDGRLEELEIAHGDLLVITDPSNFSLGGPQKKPRAPVAALPLDNLLPPPILRSEVGWALPADWSAAGSARPTWPRNTGGRNGPIPIALAAADDRSAGDIITSYQHPTTQARTHESHESHPPVIYRATFYDRVRINQPDAAGKFDQLLIDNVDQMDVDFQLKQSSSPTTQAALSASQPAPVAPATTSAPTTTADSAPTVMEVQQSASGPSPAPAPASSQPSEKEQPIYVRWTGVLRIVPLQQAPLAPLKPGDSAMKLIGFPVNIRRVDPKGQGIEHIQCASLIYASAGQQVHLDHSIRFPQVLIDKLPPASAKGQGATHFASTGAIDYSRADQRATITGAGRGQVPLEAAGQSPPSLMQVAWQKQADFSFAPGASDDQLVLRSGRLLGDVDIQHPRLKLRSQTLNLAFDSVPKAAPNSKQQSGSNLRQVVATTNVYCLLTGSDGKKQTIESNRLQLDTGIADKKVYPRHVNATGSVHAYADDDLRAENLDVLLKPAPPSRAKPTTRKSADDDAAQVELQELVAWDHVTTKSKDGSVAIGDKLTVTAEGTKQHAIISSAVQAKVADPKGNFVTGPEIQFDSGDGKAYVVGAGTLHAIRQASTTQPAEPLDVAWATGALFDGPANRVDCDGSVTAQFRDHTGYVYTATGDHIRVDLEKKPLPATPPTTQPIVAAASEPKTTTKKAPDAANGVQMDMFKDKEVVAFTLTGKLGNADMTSTLSAADGSIAQQIVLDGPRIIVRLIDPDGSNTKSLTIPAAGKMLVRDHRKSSPQPSESDSRGATGFEWHRSLVYNESVHRADMVGQVKIVHIDDDKAQVPVQVTADHVIAYFEETPSRVAPGAKAHKAQAAPNDDSRMQLKFVKILAGSKDIVSVDHGESEMRAREVDFDPIRHVLSAHGTTGNPIEFYSGTTLTRADSIDWDTITWTPHLSNTILEQRPAVPGVQAPKPKNPDQDKPLYRRSQ